MLPTIHFCVILMLCGCDTFLPAGIKMAERKKQKRGRKKVAIKGCRRKDTVLWCNNEQN